MLTILPSFYPRFVCRADRCGHSCCRGWEIDIDELTAERYLSWPGGLGEALRANMRENDGVWSFRLTADERCPFLRADNLCRLIREAGEEALCDICTMHPRFFVLAADEENELGGLGLCCEEACALLLAEERELSFYIEDSGEGLSFGEILAMTETELPPAAMVYDEALTKAEAEAILQEMGETEPIDEHWPEQLEAMRARLTELLQAAQADGSAGVTKRIPVIALQNVYRYILYRQLPLVNEAGAEAVAGYARKSVSFIRLLAALTGDWPEAVRRWSEQIEYSTENVDRLLHIL